jgi:mRNA-degrading endonuclease RelE of RelBE toxin-antitoxin system
MAYIWEYDLMLIIETSIFTRRVTELIPDDEYRELQAALVERPDAGSVIPGSGGLRKLRWSASGHGKRGGARIIYYWVTEQERILMLFIYAKNESADLTPDQIKKLKQIVEREYP